MIERSLEAKAERAQTEGFRQRALSKLLWWDYKAARMLGLQDMDEAALLQETQSREALLWAGQGQRLLERGFHTALGTTEDDYLSSLPQFQPQPERFKGKFDLPVLVDSRVPRKCS